MSTYCIVKGQPNSPVEQATILLWGTPLPSHSVKLLYNTSRSTNGIEVERSNQRDCSTFRLIISIQAIEMFSAKSTSPPDEYHSSCSTKEFNLCNDRYPHWLSALQRAHFMINRHKTNDIADLSIDTYKV